MRCESIDVIDKGEIREYTCGNTSLARLIGLDNEEKFSALTWLLRGIYQLINRSGLVMCS
ncbi:hypothetical protein [Vulcanisaeta distributa]|uniref:hypothetical protein n=1 Tax=Vulcanisaeta distributa TaxID=164451 RepID=UPI000A673183|nr:hypothetical protein [Vulcanisaeta distributa]